MSNHAQLIRQAPGQVGRPVFRRGRNFIEFDMGGGVTRYVATLDPLHYGAGLDQEIDTAWEADTGAWQYRNIKNSHLIHSRDVFNVGGLFQWDIGSEWVGIDPQSINWINQDNSRQQIAIKQAVSAVANDDWLTWTDAYKSGISYSFFAHPKRLVKNITINQLSDLPAPTVTGTIWFEAEFTITNSSGIELYLDGVKWARTNNVRVQTSNRIEFRDTNGIVQWFADAPIATDANGEKIGGQYEVRRQGGTYFITVRISRDWLVNAAYPVIIDPTFTDGYGGDVTTAKDTNIWAYSTNYDYGSNVELNVGRTGAFYTYAEFRDLIQFDVSSLSGYTINSAQLTLICIDVADSNSRNHTVHRSLVAWYEGPNNGTPAGAGVDASTWDYRNYNGSITWGAGGGQSGTDYAASAYDTVAVTGTGTYYFDLATLVSEWVAGTYTDYGLWLLGDETPSTLTRKTFASSDNATTGNRPVLVVDYSTGGSPTVTPAEGTQSQTADAITTAAIYPITPAEGTQAQAGDAALAQHVTPFTVAEGSQPQTQDAITIGGVVSPITPAEGTQSQTGDAATANAIYPITPAENTQSQTQDVITVSAGGNVTPAEGNQTQTGDSATANAIYVFTVSEGAQSQTQDAVTCSYSGPGTSSVTPAEGNQPQTQDAVIIGGVTYLVAPAEGAQSQTQDPITCSAAAPSYYITPAEGTQSQTQDAITIGGIVYLVAPAEGSQTQTMDLITASSSAEGYRVEAYPIARPTIAADTRANLVPVARANIKAR